MPNKYYVGPNLLSDIRRTIASVDNNASYNALSTGDSSPYRPVNVENPENAIFRIGTATGSWSKVSSNTVSVTSPYGSKDIQATNLFADISGGTATYSCAIARQGTAWYLIAAECQ